MVGKPVPAGELVAESFDLKHAFKGSKQKNTETRDTVWWYYSIALYENLYIGMLYVQCQSSHKLQVYVCAIRHLLFYYLVHSNC